MKRKWMNKLEEVSKALLWCTFKEAVWKCHIPGEMYMKPHIWGPCLSIIVELAATVCVCGWCTSVKLFIYTCGLQGSAVNVLPAKGVI